MADTAPSAANQVLQWADKYFVDYVRESRFAKYMGNSENSVIQAIEDLTKKPGDRVTVSLVGALTGAGVTGTGTLENNEEALTNHGHMLTVDMLRNGVRRHKMDQHKTKIDILEAAKVALKNWSKERLRDAIIAALMSPHLDGKTPYGTATEPEKNAWLLANAERVLFGSNISNHIDPVTSAVSAHAAALLNIDSANDKLSPALLSLAKRQARLASPSIRPIKVMDDQEWFVAFIPTYAFRDLKNSTEMMQANRDAHTRGRENPLFTDGDLLWDGIVCREVSDIPTISGVGAGGINVAPTFLCGAQAVGVAWGQRPQPKTETFDYGSKVGVAIEEIRGVEKLMFGTASNQVQHGVVTVYTANVADI